MYSFRSLIYLNINFYFLIKKLFQLNFIRMVHEKEIYSFKFLNLAKNTIILDVGGSDGLFYKSVRKINIQNKVVSIEPLKANLKHLKNIKKKDKNFVFYNIAISTQKILKIYTPKINEREILNFTSFSKKIIFNLKKNFKFLNTNLIKFNVSKVKTKKLDYLNKYNIGLLKLDVEGYEQNIINSGKKLIRKQKPLIYIENNTKILKKILFKKTRL